MSRTRGKRLPALRQRHMAARVAEQARCSQRAALRLVRVMEAVYRDALLRGDRFQVTGVGLFWTQTRPAQFWRDPRTGERIWLAPRRIVRFRAARTLRDRLQLEAPAAPPRGEGGEEGDESPT